MRDTEASFLVGLIIGAKTFYDTQQDEDKNNVVYPTMMIASLALYAALRFPGLRLAPIVTGFMGGFCGGFVVNLHRGRQLVEEPVIDRALTL